MSLDLTCQILMNMGLPVSKIIKNRVVFTKKEFLKLVNGAPKNEIIIWDESLWVGNVTKIPFETWAFWGWYLFQKWGFME